LFSKKSSFFIAKIVLSHQKGLFGQIFPVLSQQAASQQGLTIENLLLLDGLVIRHENEQIVLDYTDEKRDGHDWQEDPKADLRVEE